jgi:hypothetical protein
MHMSRPKSIHLGLPNSVSKPDVCGLPFKGNDSTWTLTYIGPIGAVQLLSFKHGGQSHRSKNKGDLSTRFFLTGDYTFVVPVHGPIPTNTFVSGTSSFPPFQYHEVHLEVATSPPISFNFRVKLRRLT